MFKVVKKTKKRKKGKERKQKKHCNHTQCKTFLAPLGNLTVVWILLLMSLNVIKMML